MADYSQSYPFCLSDTDLWAKRRLWDLLIVLLVLTLFVTLPFESLVTFWHPQKQYKIVMYVMDGIFWLDIIINFNAAYYHGAELVTDRKEITKVGVRVRAVRRLAMLTNGS